MDTQGPPRGLIAVSESLASCADRTRRLFLRLAEGWAGAGGLVEWREPGRISLSLRTRELDHSRHGLPSRQLDLAMLLMPPACPDARIELPNHAGPGYLDHIRQDEQRFIATVGALPGFTRGDSEPCIEMTEAFGESHCRALLEAMLDLREADRRTAVAEAILFQGEWPGRMSVRREARVQDGRLLVSGQDLGSAVQEHWGDLDYEYWLSFDEAATGQLGFMLTGEVDVLADELIDALVTHFGDLEGFERLRSLCAERGVECEFFQYV